MKKRIFNYVFVICMMLLITSVVHAEDYTTYIQCGNTAFPAPFADISKTLFTVLQVVVPIGIIIMGSVDMLKAVIAQDPEKMAKNQKKFITRLLAGAIAFFVFVIVRWVADFAADTGDFGECLDCLINGENCGAVQGDSPFDK